MKQKKAFTMIELMISIVIIGILTMVAYEPYNYYQNKAKLKIATREISQILYEGRNMAVNGSVESSGNVSIGVYFDSSESQKNFVKIFSYPYDIENTLISNVEGGDVKLIKTLNLEKGVEIDDIEGKSNILFFYDSISGKLTCYSWQDGIRTTLLNLDTITVNFSFKNSTSPNLRKYIKYFTSTNIIDY